MFDDHDPRPGDNDPSKREVSIIIGALLADAYASGLRDATNIVADAENVPEEAKLSMIAAMVLKTHNRPENIQRMIEGQPPVDPGMRDRMSRHPIRKGWPLG